MVTCFANGCFATKQGEQSRGHSLSPQSPLVNDSHPSTNGAHGSEARLTRPQEHRSGPGGPAFSAGWGWGGRKRRAVPVPGVFGMGPLPRHRDNLGPPSSSPPPSPCPVSIMSTGCPGTALPLVVLRARSHGAGVGTAPEEFRRPQGLTTLEDFQHLLGNPLPTPQAP